jgi:cation/acetate symporter
VGLVAAGGLAAALSTAAGLLIVISSAVAHDLYYKRLRPDASEAQQLRVGRFAMAGAVIVAGYFGVNPPGFVAQTVAFAFGFAAASFFPAIVLGIFWKRCNATGAISGLIAGLGITAFYIISVVYGGMEPWFGISPSGFGAIGALVNFAVTISVALATAPPPEEMQHMIEEIRYPAVSRRVATAAGAEPAQTEPTPLEAAHR